MESQFDKLEESNLWNQLFYSIHVKSSEYKYHTKESKKVENRSLNRYRDVIPFDHSRIQLKRGHNDYINANLINVEQSGRSYILTQGPLPGTVGHFWAMIWEHNSTGILMLNKLIERGDVKCHKYWPCEDQPEFHLDDVSLKVEFMEETEYEHYVIRRLNLTDTESGDSRVITQYHYTSWPDFGLPESPNSFLEFLFKVRDSGVLDKNGPSIIHCSAGIGRSGTICLVDSCLAILENTKTVDSIDVPEILLDMRKYRMGLIQTPEQLRFGYLAIIEGTKQILVNASTDVSEDKKSESEVSPIESDEEVPKPERELSPARESESEVRRRAREERQQRTKDNIKRIKERQKATEKRSSVNHVLFKYGTIVLGVVAIGVGIYLVRDS